LFLERAPSIGWLESYAQAEHLPMILQRIGERLRRPVALQEALPIIDQLICDAIGRGVSSAISSITDFCSTTLQEIELH